MGLRCSEINSSFGARGFVFSCSRKQAFLADVFVLKQTKTLLSQFSYLKHET